MFDRVGDRRIRHARYRARRPQLACGSISARSMPNISSPGSAPLTAHVPKPNSWPGLRDEKSRLAHSSAPNWMDTQAPWLSQTR